MSKTFIGLGLVWLLAAGCSPTQIGQVASALQNALPSAPKPATTSLKKVTDVSLSLAKDPEFTLVTLYRSHKFDFIAATDGTGDDFGQVEFMAWSGRSDKEDNGYFLYGRQYVNQPVELGFIDKGEVPYNSINESPEFGWSIADVGNRNRVRLKSNNVYLFRIKYEQGTRETYYGKIWIKDISTSQILFDYAVQLSPGDRKLE